MTKKIWILTLFPEFFTPLEQCGVTGSSLRGERGNKIDLIPVQIRDYSPNGHKGVDDSPYGGGAGMVMRADVLEQALLKGVVEACGYGADFKKKLLVVFPCPRGQTWNHKRAEHFANQFSTDDRDIVFIAGRYEGIDERFIEQYVDEMYSIGDYVLTGGEIAVMAIVDSFVRLLSGTVGNSESIKNESFAMNGIEYPHYTRPAIFNDSGVPQELLSGNHKLIEKFREQKSAEFTKKYRPDLMKGKKSYE